MKTTRTLGALAAGAVLAAAPAAAQAAVQVGSSGWLWGAPLPQGNTIRSMSFAGATGYAAGDFGTLLKTTDGGASWSGLSVGSFQTFTTVQALSDRTVIAGGGCVARRSDDGGATFTRIPFTPKESSCPQPLVSLSFVDGRTGWLLLGDGTVTETLDGGATYAQRTAVPGTSAAGGQATPTDLAFVSATTGYAVSSGGKIFQTTDAGQSWKVVSDTNRKVNDVTFVDAVHGFAVGDAGLFLRTVDGGATWTPKDLGAGGQNLTSVRCATTQLCIVATQSGTQLVRTPDAGDTASLVTPSTDPIFAAAFASPTRVAAAGSNGSSVVSVDGGLNFTRVGGRLTGRYFGVRAGGQTGTAYAPGDNGSLAVTLDGGKSWARGNVATSEDVRDVSFPTALTGFALDTQGGVFRTTNGGASWATLDTGTTASANAIYAPDDQTVLTIGGRGVRRSTDAGDTFSQVSGTAVARTPLSGVDRAGSAIVAWGAQDLIVSRDKGRTWRALRKPGRYVRRNGKVVNRLILRAADFVSTTRGYVVDQYGRAWRTSNGGRSWTWLYGVGTDSVSGLAFSGAKTGYLVTGGFGAVPGSGFLMRTTDAGVTWHPQFVVNSAIPPLGIAAPGGGTDYLLSGTSSLLSSTTGGDAGAASAVTLDRFTRKLRKATKITVGGRLTPASGSQRVTVSYLAPGSVRWRSTTVDTASNGRFTTSWTVAKGTNTFVAQWAGDFKSHGAGSTPLVIRVSSRR